MAESRACLCDGFRQQRATVVASVGVGRGAIVVSKTLARHAIPGRDPNWL
jgi:hypothetical protein